MPKPYGYKILKVKRYKSMYYVNTNLEKASIAISVLYN